jgi:hypothetical protein
VVLTVSAGLALASGCNSAETRRKPLKHDDQAPVVCRQDQVREFYCDGLLPMSTARGAPAPYESCPAGIEAPPGDYPRKEHVARFDAVYTEWDRQRAQPGHTCCYSWCAELTVADVDDVLPYAGCDEPGAMRELYCLAELESGTSAPAPSPLDHCPLAIRPPESKSFSVPKAAPLDATETTTRRERGDNRACCYGWCSKMPASGR